MALPYLPQPLMAVQNVPLLNLERRVGVLAVYKNTTANVDERNMILPLSWLAGVLYIEWFVPTEFTEDLYAYGIHQCT
jgi:hypothetical protein